jgi:hypothetical protein
MRDKSEPVSGISRILVNKCHLNVGTQRGDASHFGVLSS